MIITSNTDSFAEKDKTSLSLSDPPRTIVFSNKPFEVAAVWPYYVSSFLYYLYYILLRDYDNPYLVLWFSLGLFPLLEYYIKHDWVNPTKEQYKLLENDIKFMFPLYITSFLDWVFTMWVINYASKRDFALVELLVIVLATGSVNGVNFQIAHELYHQQHSWSKTYGVLTLAKHFYMHSWISHTISHHRYVATPLDPGFAPLGESFFKFLAHAIPGNFHNAWRYECKRLTAFGHRSAYNLQNRMIWMMLGNLGMTISMRVLFGWYGLLVFCLIAAWSVIGLESINYIEHYGLLRKEIAPGVYEKVNMSHSWNSSQRLINYLIFKVQRHSDHHENAYKPYHTLLLSTDSPMLPCGYLGAALMAIQPKVWFRVMDPLAIAYSKEIKLDDEKRTEIQRVVAGFMWVHFVLISVLAVCVMLYRITCEL